MSGARRGRPSARVVAAAAVLLLAAGCSSTPADDRSSAAPRSEASDSAGPTSAAPSTPPPGSTRSSTPAATTAGAPTGRPATAADLTAGLKQSRVGIGARKMDVLLTNNSASDLDIVTADLLSGYFAAPAPTYHDTTVRAGAALSLSFSLPAPNCAADAKARVRVVIAYRSAGVTGTMTVAPVDTYGSFEEVHVTDCSVQKIDDLVTLSIGDSLKVVDRGGKSVGVLELTLTPRSTAEKLVVTELERTTLLVPDGTATWTPTGLDNTRGGPVTAALEVIPARCDPHAVAEDKRGTFLGTHISVDGRELPVVFTEIPQHTKGLIYQYVSDYCGW